MGIAAETATYMSPSLRKELTEEVKADEREFLEVFQGGEANIDATYKLLIAAGIAKMILAAGFIAASTYVQYIGATM